MLSSSLSADDSDPLCHPFLFGRSGQRSHTDFSEERYAFFRRKRSIRLNKSSECGGHPGRYASTLITSSRALQVSINPGKLSWEGNWLPLWLPAKNPCLNLIRAVSVDQRRYSPMGGTGANGHQCSAGPTHGIEHL